MFENRLYKVTPNDGGTFITATFFNPVTGEEKSLCIRDYEYEDCRRDNDELYYMQVDENARRVWCHKHGNALENDRVMIVKGRKIPHGTVCTVKEKFKVYDRYGRFCAWYYRFTDGQKTNVDNCVLVLETEE